MPESAGQDVARACRDDRQRRRATDERGQPPRGPCRRRRPTTTIGASVACGQGRARVLERARLHPGLAAVAMADRADRRPPATCSRLSGSAQLRCPRVDQDQRRGWVRRVGRHRFDASASESLVGRILGSRVDCASPTDPQTHMGTRKTRTTPRSRGSLEPPFPATSQSVSAPLPEIGSRRFPLSFRASPRASPPVAPPARRPGRKELHCERTSWAHERSSPRRPRRGRPLQPRPVHAGRCFDHDGGPADHPHRQGAAG